MAQALFDMVVPAGASGSSTNPWIYPWVNGSTPYTPAWSGSAVPKSYDIHDGEDPGDLANVTGVAPHTPLGPNAVGLMASWHTDFHFRFWTIPNALNLSNPTLGANIPFNIWNTFDTTGTVSAVNVTGSSVLSFDYGASNTIAAGEYKEVNMQIAAGEPTISATVDFVHDLGTASLSVIAIVAETFPILPEVPVNESWEFRTDILTNYKGRESRLALLDNPRIQLDFNVRVVDFEERRILYGLSASNIKVASVVPLFQYAAPVTQTTSIGSDRLYFDPALCNARVGKNILALNRATREIQLGTVTTLHSDGATINAAVGVDIDPGVWFVVPGLLCFISDDSGLDFGTQAGTYSLSAESVETYDLPRPSSIATINTFDSLPLVEKKFLITEPERFAYRRELLDNGVGAQEIRSRDDYFVTKRNVKFPMDRAGDDYDYWRDFFDLIKGAQKPFLLSTQLPDLTLRVAHTDGASTLEVNEQYYESKLYPLDAFKRVQITYTDDTSSNHNVTSTTTDASNNLSITISPALTLGKTVSRISFLQKVRGSDKITLEHYNDYSYIKFGARTTNT